MKIKINSKKVRILSGIILVAIIVLILFFGVNFKKDVKDSGDKLTKEEKLKQQNVLKDLEAYSEECRVYYDSCVQDYCSDVNLEGEECWSECEFMVLECESRYLNQINKLEGGL